MPPVHSISVVWPHSVSRLMATSCHRFAEFCPLRYILSDTFLDQLVLDGAIEGSKLKLLSLRSGKFHPSTTQDSRTRFLAMAASAARTLSRLRIMEMWNTGPGYAYIFRYAKDNGRAMITWRRAGQDFSLTPVVLNAWAGVDSSGLLLVKRIQFAEADGEELWFNGKPIYRYLALRRITLDPITVAQLVAEVVLQHEMPTWWSPDDKG